MNSQLFATLLACGLAAPLAAGGAIVLTAQEPVDYARDVLPILAARCHGCHGEDLQEGDLRLDRREDALRGGDHPDVLVPGDSARSRLVRYVAGARRRMPPDGEPLTPTQVATLRSWVDAGAAWPEGDDGGLARADRHWSFRPVRRPQVPTVEGTSWVRNPIDAFVLARLEQEGLAPAPEADRRTLVRRLYLDLIGLPPAPEDASEFEADSRTDAYERLVDRLLASPHFGERWGRHWMDRARFAETSGCVIDLLRPYLWRWRDWVIRSINTDQPFDEFTFHQLAGDLLPVGAPGPVVATGFHRNAIENHEGGTDVERERVKTVVDRTNAVGVAWLGLTVGCAECHSHKYDPISQEDYYRLFAFFNDLDDADVDAAMLGEEDRLDGLRRELEGHRARYASTPAEGQAAWERAILEDTIVWVAPSRFEAASYRSDGHAFLAPLPDGSFGVTGRFPSRDYYQLTFPAPPGGVAAVRLEALPDPDRCDRGPGRRPDGRFLVSKVTVEAAWADAPEVWRAIDLENVVVDLGRPGSAPHGALDDDDQTGWAGDRRGVPNAAAFVARGSLAARGAERLRVSIEQGAGQGQQLGRFRVTYTTDDPGPSPARPVPDVIRALAELPPGRRMTQQRAELKRYYQAAYRPEAADLASWDAALTRFAEAAGRHAAHVVRQRPSSRPTFVHLRGDPERPGKRVGPAILPLEVGASRAEDPSPDGGTPSRIDLARWVAHGDNPLTSRVAMNDVWQHLFGNGLVRTPDDFGRQGEPPTHPELLDWLADEFVRGGWSRKRMVRLVVTSSSYRQDASMRPGLAGRDPENRLLARQGRYRLEAEAIRDAALAVSGLLEPQVGGPSFELGEHQPRPWQYSLPDPGPRDAFRRGLYAFSPRTSPHPTLDAFDLPGAAPCTRRLRTNTPLQALALQNGPVFVEAAKALASWCARSSEGDLEAAFERCLTRRPDVEELRALQALYDGALADFRARPDDPVALLNAGPDAAPDPEQAAWFVVMRTLLNADEMLTRP
jgi:hypothetical protein